MNLAAFLQVGLCMLLVVIVWQKLTIIELRAEVTGLQNKLINKEQDGDI